MDCVRFQCTVLNTVLATDFTYMHTEFDWRYLAVVIDLFNYSVVGWSIKDNMGKEMMIETMKMAIKS